MVHQVVQLQKPGLYKHVQSKVVPSSCFEVLLLRELQEGGQPADGARHNSPTRLRRKLLNNRCKVQVESLV